MRFLILLSLLFSVSAEAGWKHLRCQRAGDNEYLLITRDADTRVHVETERTQRYLLGLTCNIPFVAEPLFLCRGPGSNDLTFRSAWVHERGFPKDAYEEPVDRELLNVVLSFSYVNGKGETSRLEKIWKFEKNECVGSEQ